MDDYVIQMKKITKVYPNGIVANQDVDFSVKRGEIHALMGENGAGKSTLMKMLFGLEQPTSGEIWVNGEKVSLTSPNVALQHGIGMVHQHFMLVPSLTVAENMVLGMVPTKNGLIDYKKAVEITEEYSKKFNLEVEPNAKVRDIPVGMKQKVEILKALVRGAKILILDEPTAVLTTQETTELFRELKNLKNQGFTLIFISHKLNEIMEVADRVTVLRKGKCIGTVNVKDTNEQELSRMMVGRDVQLVAQKKDATPGDTVLSVENMTVPSRHHKIDAVKGVSFHVRAGEIVCIAGIDGNGQTELVYGLTGLEPVSSGTVTLCGQDITHASIRQRSQYLSHIPEDRQKHGLVLDYPLDYNMVLERYWQKEFTKGGFLRRAAIRSYANQLIDKFDVRSGQGAATITRSMSGGNQQKAILARELDKDHKLLVAVQPTRGLDVGAIEFIHKELIAERDKGTAVLLVSLELEEVMNVSDRILVMYEGQIVGQFDPKKTDPEELGLYMAGARRQEVKA